MKVAYDLRVYYHGVEHKKIKEKDVLKIWSNFWIMVSISKSPTLHKKRAKSRFEGVDVRGILHFESDIYCSAGHG